MPSILDAQHPEFEGRFKHGVDLTGEGPGARNGHRTHVAGIVGGRKPMVLPKR